MKKTLLAAALLAGYAGAASAQSTVTLYGVVSVGIEYISVNPGNNYRFLNPVDAARNGTSARNNFGMVSGQQSGSRWGLKGVEDLGNGLKANFVYESGVNVTSGASTGFTRQATLGLSSSSWGALDLGRRTSPGTYAFSGIDPFGASFGTAALDSSMGTQFIRYSNMIMYTTPNFSGFTGSIGYSFNTGLNGFTTAGGNVVPLPGAPRSFETTNKQRAISIGLRYANGPIVLGGAYDQVNAPGSLNLASERVSSWMIGGTYDFKVVKLHAAYGQSIDGIIEGTSALTNAGITGGVTNTSGGVLFAQGARTNSWMIGASAPIGAATKVFASFQQMKPGGTFDTAFTATQSVASIGATYNLSKRTNFYGFYSYGNNYAMIDGAKTNTVGVGIRHLF